MWMFPKKKFIFCTKLTVVCMLVAMVLWLSHTLLVRKKQHYNTEIPFKEEAGGVPSNRENIGHVGPQLTPLVQASYKEFNHVATTTSPTTSPMTNVITDGKRSYKQNNNDAIKPGDDNNGRTPVLKLNNVNNILPQHHTSTKVSSIIPSSKSPVTNFPNCSAIVAGNTTELENFIKHKRQRKNYSWRPLSDQPFAEQVKNCSYFSKKRLYPKEAYTHVEAMFPIAYILTVHTKSMQMEHLLRAIYSPQNIYCIHVDRKAVAGFKQAMINIAMCFPNVFVASQLEDVNYATHSRLKADINCLQDLVKKNHSWKYAINLVGQDFPIKSNYEIVTYLQRLNGKNDIPGELSSHQHIINRFKFKHKHKIIDGSLQYLHENETKSDPPGNLTIYFGTAFFISSRAFVQHILTDKLAINLLQWFKDTYSPDEHFWITLNSIPGIPGGSSTPSWMSSVRLIRWQDNPDQSSEPPCQGKWVRTICVFGLGDLAWVIKQHHLFANKFDYYFDVHAILCLEKWISSKTAVQRTT